MSVAPARRIAVCHNTSQYLYLHYRQLLGRLVDGGHPVRVIAPRDRYTGPLERIGVSFAPWSLQQHGMNPLREWGSLLELRRLLHEYDPTDVFTFSIKPNLYAGIVNRGGRYRHYAMVTGLGYVFIGDGVGKRLLRRGVVFAARQGLRRARRVFFQNPVDRDTLAGLGVVGDDQAVVIPGTGIDCDFYAPPQSPRDGEPVRFLFIGRLLKDKGVAELIEAAGELSGGSAEVRLVGPYDGNPGGIDRGLVAAAAASGTVTAVGEVEDVRGELAAADVFVLPSYREGLSRSILEAMACALPIITTDVPGCRDLVEDGINGLLVPPRDPLALLRAMRTLCGDPALRRRMGMASRNIARERYDHRVVNDLILEQMDLVQ